jgi:hypothetical protein
MRKKEELLSLVYAAHFLIKLQMQYKCSSLLLTLAVTLSDHHSLVTEQEHLLKDA